MSFIIIPNTNGSDNTVMVKCSSVNPNFSRSDTVMAVRATPKALMLIEEKKDEYETDTLSPIETVKTVWTCYIPSVIVGGVSIFCLIGASSVNLRRNAALATAYTLSESALKEYQEKVVETIGDKKERDIRDSIAKDKVEQNPVVQKEIIITEKVQW